MQMRIFTKDHSAEAEAIQSEVNDFLATLSPGAVKHITSDVALTRSAFTDKSLEHYVITVWYEA